MLRRSLLVTTLALPTLVPSGARAQGFPTRPVRMAMIVNGVSLPIEPFFERLRESFERSVANAVEDELRSGPLASVIEALRDVETAVKTGTLNAVRKVFPAPEE